MHILFQCSLPPDFLKYCQNVHVLCRVLSVELQSFGCLGLEGLVLCSAVSGPVFDDNMFTAIAACMPAKSVFFPEER